MSNDAGRVDPLSYGQQALWFLHQLAPASTAYNFVFAARVSGTHTALLRSCLQQLVDRHSMLRTTYSLEGGAPVQLARPGQPVDLAEIPLPRAPFSEIRRRLTEEVYRPFDLDRGPVFRATIITGSAAELFLALSAHHIAIDFHSISILLSDLGKLHIAARQGALTTPQPRGPWYADYVRWQHELVRGPEGRRLFAYWRDRLAGSPPLLQMPLDRPRPAVQSYRGFTITRDLGRDRTSALERLARDCDATPFAALLALFQMLLHEWSGQEEVLVGCPAPGRPENLSDVVGYFVNPVVVRTAITSETRPMDLIRRAQVSLAEALAHQFYPFPLLVERMHPVRDAGYSPVFQVLFAFYELEEHATVPLLLGAEGVRVEVGDLQLESLALEHRGAMLDLSLIAVKTGGRLTLYFQYNADLFNNATIEALSRRFERLLDQAVAPPAEAVRTAPALAPVEPRTLAPRRPMSFSLFFFASEERDRAESKYRLLFEVAKFADRRGFAAIWTPERHFHPFGGIYPNPAVTGAAVAALTSRIQIRAGSVVLPLHHPIRVAEEWAVVDNISNGRVAVAFASGWHAHDFVFAPENYVSRREVMRRHIESVRRLWRGECESYPGGDGKAVEVNIRPRPVQPELPIWLSAFGSPETFRLAGQIGAGVLTHLLGQSLADLGRKIALYRTARREHGHDPSGGQVAVMLHTFLDSDINRVRYLVREPFLEYLRNSVDLARAGEQAGLPAEGEHYRKNNVDAFLEATFERYFASSALFGTPETCQPLVAQLQEAGVTEIACLIDFGVDIDTVLTSLEWLDRLKNIPPDLVYTPLMDPAGVSQAAVSVEQRVEARRQSLARHVRARDRAVHPEPLEDEGR
jgi:natural product biosynthesis luciferase-like monooxygenase protein